RPAKGLRFNTRNPAVGALLIVVGIVMQIIYPIFYYVVISKGLIKYSSYKFYSMLIDPFPGIFLIFDIEYCDEPQMIYIMGCGINGIWVGFTTSSVLVLANRALEMFSFKYMRMFFRGALPYLWILVSFGIGIWGFFAFRPVIFNAQVKYIWDICKAISWIWDPQIPDDGYDFLSYPAPKLSVNNIVTCSSISLIYCLIIAGNCTQRESLTSQQIEVLTQSAIISLFSFVTSSLYILMQYIPVPSFLITVAFLCYVGSSIAPGIVFILFNRDVRETAITVFMYPFK
ncbi:hypothetical protein PFISCL1PPCAC_14776, partial [Pristionchus fissidentatus]